MKTKLLLVAMTTLVAVGLIAPAVNADVNGTGTLAGSAQVGQHFRNEANTADTDCNKESVKDAWAHGQGLYFPVIAPPKNGVWSLHIPALTLIGTDHTGTPGMIAGTLDACGFLMHTLRDALAQGPACGISKGHSGLGQVNFEDGGGINLFDLQWKPSSAGGVLPVVGKYQVWNGVKPEATKGKKNKWGNILAQVVALGGQRCAESKNCANQKTAPNGTPGCGAQSFIVNGTFELVQAPDRNMDGKHSKKEVIRPKDLPDGDKDYNDGPLCKGAPPCPFDPNKGNGKETPKPKPTYAP